jgi:hypothetical protein
MDLIIFADYFNENLDCISYPFQNLMYLFFSIDDILNLNNEIRFFGMKDQTILFTGIYKEADDKFKIFIYEKFNSKDFSELIDFDTPYIKIFNVIKNLSNLFFKHISLMKINQFEKDELIEINISIKYNKYKLFGTKQLNKN